MSLRRRTVSAVRWVTAGSILRSGFQFLQLIVLARMLGAEVIGLMGMIIVVIGLLQLLADLGVNSAILQASEVTSRERSSLFYFNICLSLCFAATLTIASPSIAIFFQDPRLAAPLAWSSLLLVITASGAQLRVIAEKELAFRSLVTIEVIAAITGLATAIALAQLSYGVYALIGAALVSSSVTAVGLWFFVSAGWRPIYGVRLNDLRRFLGFGSTVVANSFVTSVSTSIDSLLAARLLATDVFGHYSLPRNLSLQGQLLLGQIVNRVSFPLVATLQEQKKAVREVYLLTLNMTVSVSAIPCIYVAFFAPSIVFVLLGEAWAPAGEPLRYFAVWALLRSIANPIGGVLLGLGMASTLLRYNLMLLLILPLAVWIGAAEGAKGVAMALAITQLVLVVPLWLLMVRDSCEVSLKTFLGVSLRPMAIAAISVSMGWFLVEFFSGLHLKLMLSLAVSFVVYLLLSWRMNNSFARTTAELLYSKVSRD